MKFIASNNQVVDVSNKFLMCIIHYIYLSDPLDHKYFTFTCFKFEHNESIGSVNVIIMWSNQYIFKIKDKTCKWMLYNNFVFLYIYKKWGVCSSQAM